MVIKIIIKLDFGC